RRLFTLPARQQIVRYKFSLPTKKSGGTSLVGSRMLNLYRTICCRAGKVNRRLWKKLVGRNIDGVGRNYGKDKDFLNSIEGQRQLQHSIAVLLQRGILRGGSDGKAKKKRIGSKTAKRLITLRYAFDKEF
ncbi:hypothetical protein ACFL1G_08150, partial [Planctomycetota bacterium]